MVDFACAIWRVMVITLRLIMEIKMSFENIFKPEAKNLKSLFGNVDSFYEIPDYQRPYSWEKEQIEELWDDIIDACSKNEDTYFLGSPRAKTPMYPKINAFDASGCQDASITRPSRAS